MVATFTSSKRCSTAGKMTELQYDAHAVESLEIERDWLLAAKSGSFCNLPDCPLYSKAVVH